MFVCRHTMLHVVWPIQIVQSMSIITYLTWPCKHASGSLNRCSTPHLPCLTSVLLSLWNLLNHTYTLSLTYPLLCCGCCPSCPGWETSFHLRHLALRIQPWFWGGAVPLPLLEACFLTSQMVYYENLEDPGSCQGAAHSSDPKNQE